MKIKDNLSKILGVFIIMTFSIYGVFLSTLNFDRSESAHAELASYSSLLENKFYDFRASKQEPNVSINKDIILIKLDNESLQKIGTWPLPRTTWSDLIDKLGRYGSKVIAFDILFPENAPLLANSNPDLIFKDSILNFQRSSKNKIILPYSLTDHKTSSSYEEAPFELLDLMLNSRQESSRNISSSYVEKYTYPIEELLSATPDLGYISMNEDNDGVFRHYKLVANVEEANYGSIALRSYMAFSEKKPNLVITEYGSSYLELENNKIFLNQKGESKVRWFGAENNFYNIPLWKVLDADDNDQKISKIFKNKIVFIGSTATGAHDMRNTPVSPTLPGVYAHINMVHMLMNNFRYLSKDISINYSLIFLVVSIIILLFLMSFSNAILDLLTISVLFFILYKVDIHFFLPNGYEIKLAFTLVALGSTYSWITFLNFYKSNKEKKQIKGAFSRYVAPSIVNDMLSNPEKLKVGGERKDITCLFSDVRDFTSISEELSAADLAKCLNKYMGRMTDIVFENSGTLDKYIGDAIVAFWGAPLDLDDHASYALRASVQMLEVLPEINQEFKQEGFPEFKIGLGLNSGECNVGNMGSDSIFAYTALGDNMNLGARLESLCKHYGAQILISGKTFERINKEEFKCRKIDNVQVKGKEEGSLVYEVLYSYHPFYMDSYSFENFNSAYSLFEKREFKSAQKMISKVLESHPKDIPSILLKAKIDACIQTVPSIGTDHTLTRMTKK